jgi:hypothetical protein
MTGVTARRYRRACSKCRCNEGYLCNGDSRVQLSASKYIPGARSVIVLQSRQLGDRNVAVPATAKDKKESTIEQASEHGMTRLHVAQVKLTHRPVSHWLASRSK